MFALKNIDKYGHIPFVLFFSRSSTNVFPYPYKGNDSDILLTLLEDFSSEAELASTFHFILLRLINYLQHWHHGLLYTHSYNKCIHYELSRV